MKRQGDKATRRQGGGQFARTLCVTPSPCPLVSASPCLRVPLSVSSYRRQAFTLPEVLVSLVLVGVVLPAVMKGLSAAMAASDDARKRVEATGLAETKLDELTADAKSAGSGGSSSGNFGADHAAFQWTSSTKSFDTDLTEIHVRVTWTARGAERHVDLAGFAYLNTGTGGTPDGASPPPGGTP